MKSWLISLSLIVLLINNIKSLKIDEYTKLIEELILDEQFLEDYTKWSFKLFSQPDYIYGKKPGAYPCDIPEKGARNDPITVHSLRPIDVQCVGAIGDSLTAGLGAHALTPIGLFTENRGVSWSIGGDYTYNRLLTFPNILRLYNPDLKGYATKSSVIFLKGQNSSHNALSVAKSGAESIDMSDQAHLLYERIVSDKYCDMKNDWKVITLFVGGNDLCLFCEDGYIRSPLRYKSNIEETLDFIQANFPRTFVNLVLVLNITGVQQLNAGGNVCQLLHKKTCPCGAFPTEKDNRTLQEWVPIYHQYLIDLVNSGKYDKSDDFTVVIQPFMAHTNIPKTDAGEIDYSYFAPDCFHFSGKGHTRAALSLWNNMLEEIGQKQWEWHEEEKLECPTVERPYFATSKNSAQSFEKIPPKKFQIQ
jgi:phospholipase B1